VAGGGPRFVTIVDPESLQMGKCDDYLRSLQRFGREPEILQTFDKAIGFGSRIYSLHRYLADAADLADDGLVVCSDSHDVLVANDPAALESAYARSGFDVVFGAELGFCHQDEATRPVFDSWFAHAPFRYLNAGFVAGNKRALLHFYGAVIEQIGPPRAGMDDQWILGRFLAQLRGEGRHAVAGLDCHARMVTTVSSSLQLPAEISSALVHVTWLQNPAQRAKYEAIKRRIPM
jgi:hypothetical protein